LEHLASGLRIEFAQKSDAGRKPENQDTIGARMPTEPLLASKGIAIAIADGVSSSAAAQQASQAAITGFLSDYYATPDTWGTKRSALQVIESLNRYLWGQSRNSVSGQGHLTTFSALILKGNTAFIFHVGDTRIYHLRGDTVEQITRDHAQSVSRTTTYLSRALGADLHVEIDLHTVELQENDLFVLTSDGIHDSFPDATWHQLLQQHKRNLEGLVDAAMDEAFRRQSADNLSIQVARIQGLGAAPRADSVAVLQKLPFPPFLKPGDQLDGYRVKRILHETERSQVYLVESAEGKPLVMKTPSVNYEDDPAYLERFALEAWIGARVSSSYVVRVVQPERARSHLYYLTEYLPGQTLAALIEERAPLDIPVALELIEHLIKGARAFHRRDTLHQDLKPGNVIVSAQGAVIVDFGSCWVAGVQETGANFARDWQLGTLDYSAPEYRTGGPVDARSDQFSLAVILYEMLTGAKPYGVAYSKAKDAKALQRLRYVPAQSRNPMVPPWLDSALAKALSLQPKERYSALSEWMLDLQRPNPLWVKPQAKALLERNPIRFWQILALLGWLSTALLLGWKFWQT
jgi:serine/threonine protein phosphatase PrpC